MKANGGDDFRQSLPVPATAQVKLNQSEYWQRVMRAAQKQANVDEPQNLPSCTAQEVQEALGLTEQPLVRFALMMAWLYAGRMGDILKLEKANVTLEDQTRKLKVRFFAGKGVEFNDPYTLCSTVPADWIAEVRQHLDAAARRRDGRDREVQPGAPGDRHHAGEHPQVDPVARTVQREGRGRREPLQVRVDDPRGAADGGHDVEGARRSAFAGVSAPEYCVTPRDRSA